jgi:dTDP-4-amino-4,6-dideoxygalactose transaminase
LRAGELPPWPQFEAAERLATHRCRTAIRAVLPALGIGPGAEVLAPAYNCGSEIAAVLATGATIRMYDVTPDAGINTEAILARLTPATKAVYVIHYFGWPQDLDPIRRLCDARGLLLFEDCALSLFSCDEGGWMGRWGDASFFSVMKSFGVPDGAVTLLRKPLGLRFSNSPTIPLLKEYGRLSKRALLRGLTRIPIGAPRGLSAGKPYRLPKLMLGGLEPMPDAYHYNDTEMTGSSISRVTLGVINDVASVEIVRARRSNYLQLIDGIRGVQGAQTLFPTIPDGVCPLVAPLVVGDRQRWMERLSRLGAHPTAWWSGYHPDLDFTAYPNACLLKDSIVALPVHQQLNKEDMDFLIGCVHQVAAGVS